MRPFTDHLGDLAADIDESSAASDAPDEPDATNPPDAGPKRALIGGTGADEELRTHRDALLRLGREYLAVESGPGSVAGFVSWLDLANVWRVERRARESTW